MSDRFFVESPIVSDVARLTGAEAQHAAKAMRLKAGDSVVLFDGAGDEFSAQISQVSKSAVDCKIIEKHPVCRELSHDLILHVALPKGDRQRWLVEKAVELGVSQFVPLITERGVARPTNNALTRLRKTVIEACKQCGRNKLMQISNPCNLQQVQHQAGTQYILAHPGTPPLAMVRDRPGPISTAVGPEGGFSDHEVAEAVQAGWTPCSLGSRVLRVETAAVALATWASLQGDKVTR